MHKKDKKKTRKRISKLVEEYLKDLKICIKELNIIIKINKNKNKNYDNHKNKQRST
jgi:hypothetical protein